MVILYADDDEDDRRIFSDILSQVVSPYVCLEARNGMEAITLLSHPSTKEPDIIFLDVHMPMLDGYETLALIRQDPRYSSTRVIMFSTEINATVQAEYEHLNAEHLKKATRYTDFVEGLRTIFSNHKK